MTDGEQIILDALTRISKQLEEIARSQLLREKDQWASQSMPLSYDLLHDLSLPTTEPEWS